MPLMVAHSASQFVCRLTRLAILEKQMDQIRGEARRGDMSTGFHLKRGPAQGCKLVSFSQMCHCVRLRSEI
jgi:hypothetical protein